MSFLHNSYFNNPVYLGELNPGRDLQHIKKEVYQAVSSMTPKERLVYLKRMQAIYRQMPVNMQRYAQKLEKRLKVDIREPGLNGAAAAGSVANTIASITQAVTAIAGAYMAYEGIQEQKEAREAADRRAAAEAEMQRAIEKERLAQLQQEREMKQRLYEQQLAQVRPSPSGPGTSQAPYQGAPQRQGGGISTPVLIGGGAAAAALVAMSMKG